MRARLPPAQQGHGPGDLLLTHTSQCKQAPTLHPYPGRRPCSLSAEAARCPPTAFTNAWAHVPGVGKQAAQGHSRGTQTPAADFLARRPWAGHLAWLEAPGISFITL